MFYDVAIIGAGPAGTAAAFDLLKNNRSVLILDKHQFPRKKACAGGITPKCLKSYAYDISSLVKQVCHTVNVRQTANSSFGIHNLSPLCYMTDRKDLDLFCLNKAIEQGGVFKVVKKIVSISEHSDHVEIRLPDKRYFARYLIGADGSNSMVRRLCSKKHHFSRQMALEADLNIDATGIKMEFDFSKIKNGYYWIFPKKDHINVGIYSTDPETKIKTQFLKQYAFERFGSKKLYDIKGYPICTGGFKYSVDSRRIFLSGDAAGMSERMLGEGIYFAVKTGRAAARAIVESANKNIPAVILYQRDLKYIQTDLKLHDMASRCLYRFPKLSLKGLSYPLIHSPFAVGYAKGRPLVDILTSFFKFKL